MIADKAYDSDPLRKRLRQRGIELICPHKKNRVRPATQDGRALRRYRRRWIVERTIGWLGNFRRLVVRYDRSLTIYRAFFRIACFMIVLRRVVQQLLASSRVLIPRSSRSPCGSRRCNVPKFRSPPRALAAQSSRCRSLEWHPPICVDRYRFTISPSFGARQKMPGGVQSQHRGGGFLLYQLSVEDLTVDIIKDDGQNVPLLAAESDGKKP